MIGWAEAQARILALGTAGAAETVPLDRAAGRWLARDLVAAHTRPPRALSSMDGYALAGGGPWRVVGEVAAGEEPTLALATGEAVRIFTGAALPAGADRVLVQEEALRDGDTLRADRENPPIGSFVRGVGSDFAAGSVLIAAGAHVTPLAVALAAAAGSATLDVHTRPRVALLSTGDELLRGQPDANRPMLAAMLESLPVVIVDLGIVGDDRAALATAFEAARSCDLLVTSGGASVGDHDLVRPGLVEIGGVLDLWRVAMRPGKPLLAGRLGTTAVIGLPGNPVSAFVTATLFVLPLARRLAGASDPLPRVLTARVAVDMAAVGARTEFVRASWCGNTLEPLPSTDSGALAAAVGAEVLIVRERGSDALSAGSGVSAIAIA